MGVSYNSIGIQGYAEVAVLMNAIYSGQTSITVGGHTLTVSAADLSEAIWVTTSTTAAKVTPVAEIGAISGHSADACSGLGGRLWMESLYSNERWGLC